MPHEALPDDDDLIPDDDPRPDFPFSVPLPLYVHLDEILQHHSESLLEGAEFYSDIHGPSRWGLFAISIPNGPLNIGLFLGPQHRQWLSNLPVYGWNIHLHAEPDFPWIECGLHVPQAAVEYLSKSFTQDPLPADDFDLMMDALPFLRARLTKHWPNRATVLVAFHRTPMMQRVEQADPPQDL